ncbi:TonB-dependent receptor [Sphingomicrobium sp. XHP0235]|uniref:TonB-dependent receptor n=1 Tax=Sphingomicrobium aquimarinum TaxID=3133971 RepID=UPI0031FE832A
MTVLSSLLLASLHWNLQPEPAETDEAPDEIVITATRTPTPLEAVPFSVSLLDAEALEAAIGHHRAEDLTDLLVGVEAAVANGTQVAFQIRGIGAVDHQALTPTAAAVHADGVYLATNVQTGLMLYDLERVEMLKGPQGTLYGRNASGGAINLVSKRPTAEREVRAAIGVGTYGRYDADFIASGPVARDLDVRVATSMGRRDPVLDNVAGPKAAGGEREDYGARLSALWTPRDGEVLLRAHYERDDGVNTTPRNDALDLDRHEIASEGTGIRDTRNAFYGLAADVTVPLGAWSLKALSALEGYRQNYGFDFDGTPAPFGNSNLNANLLYDRSFLQLSQEIRLARETTWGSSMAGLYVAHEDFSQRYVIWCGTLDEERLLGTCPYVGAPGRVGPTPASETRAFSLVTDIEQERLALATFTFNEIALSDRIVMTVGARLNHEVIDGAGQGIHVFENGTRAFNDRGGLGDAIGANRIVDTRLSGNAALSAHVGPGRAYVSIANSYKSGGFNGEVANNATFYADEGLFGPETVTAYELGYKARFSNALRGSVAAFYQDYRSPQARIFVTFPLPDGSTIVSNSLSNLDAATSLGAEAEIEVDVAPGLTLELAGIFNETRIDQKSDVGGNAALFDGNSLPFAPRVSGRLGVRYDTALSKDVTMSLGTNIKARSRYYLDPEGLDERSQPGFATVQAQAGFAFERSGLSVTLWGRNLTNRDTAVSGYGFIGYNMFRSDPRSVGLQLGMKL